MLAPFGRATRSAPSGLSYAGRGGTRDPNVQWPQSASAHSASRMDGQARTLLLLMLKDAGLMRPCRLPTRSDPVAHPNGPLVHLHSLVISRQLTLKKSPQSDSTVLIGNPHVQTSRLMALYGIVSLNGFVPSFTATSSAFALQR
jgi:hypothetical protein